MHELYSHKSIRIDESFPCLGTAYLEQYKNMDLFPKTVTIDCQSIGTYEFTHTISLGLLSWSYKTYYTVSQAPESPYSSISFINLLSTTKP